MMQIGNREKRLQIRLLGGIQISNGDEPLTGFVSNKSLALLCYLAMNQKKHRRMSVASLLWGEMPDDKARTNLRKTLTNLRDLAGEHLEIDRQTISWAIPGSCDFDVLDFLSKLDLAKDSQDDAVRREHLKSAISLYHGDFMDGFEVQNAPKLDEWITYQREKLKNMAIFALHSITDYAIRTKEYGLGIQYALRQLEIEPSLEEAHQQIMILFAKSGQRSAALMQFKACTEILEERLSVKPSAETQRLYRWIAEGTFQSEPYYSHDLQPLGLSQKLR